MIVWITGASTGIGRAVALQYCAAGVTVIATARNEAKLQALKTDASGLRGSIHTRSADVTKTDDIKDTFKWITEHFGTPNKVILNAGTYFPTPASKLSAREHADIMEINYGGVVNCLEAILPTLTENGTGQIAIVASVAGYRGLPNASAYSASKSALIALAESLREDLKLSGIDMKLINPGFVKTPLTDQNDFHMPFLMDVEDAAKKIIQGLEKKQFEISFPLPFALIMKMLRVLPDWAYFRIAGKMLR